MGMGPALWGMTLLAAAAKGFTAQATTLHAPGTIATNGTTEWHTPQGLSEPGFESGPRVEVILAILLTPLILKLVTRLPQSAAPGPTDPTQGTGPPRTT